MAAKSQIVNVAQLDDGRMLVYCPACSQGYVQPSAHSNAGEVFYCCGEEKWESVELEEAFRRGLILSTEDNEFFTISLRDILAASLRDVA